MMTLYSFMGSRRRSQISDALAQWRIQPLAPSERTQCPKGHLYDVRQLRSDGYIGRRCSICRKAHNDFHNAKQKAQRQGYKQVL